MRAEDRPPCRTTLGLNNERETLVRRARGYRNHEYLLRKLDLDDVGLGLDVGRGGTATPSASDARS